ncbi:MAG: DUF3152 domain-containing protein [Actinomycetaceae bacterium]|nr:DUF3152 domain-containing protein [Actinomycetaceae bacterium]
MSEQDERQHVTGGLSLPPLPSVPSLPKDAKLASHRTNLGQGSGRAETPPNQRRQNSLPGAQTGRRMTVPKLAETPSPTSAEAQLRRVSRKPVVPKKAVPPSSSRQIPEKLVRGRSAAKSTPKMNPDVEHRKAIRPGQRPNYHVAQTRSFASIFEADPMLSKTVLGGGYNRSGKGSKFGKSVDNSAAVLPKSYPPGTRPKTSLGSSSPHRRLAPENEKVYSPAASRQTFRQTEQLHTGTHRSIDITNYTEESAAAMSGAHGLEYESRSSMRGIVKRGRNWKIPSTIAGVLVAVMIVVLVFFQARHTEVAGQALPDQNARTASATAGGPKPKEAIAPVDPNLVPSGLTSRTYSTPSSSGKIIAVPGANPAPAGNGAEVSYDVSYEDGLPLDPDLFAKSVHAVLNDGRGWVNRGKRYARSDYQAAYRIQLVTPKTVQAKCSGLVQDGFASCLVGNIAYINSDRWFSASPAWLSAGGSVDEYRAYLLNYFAGLAAKEKLAKCPGAGQVAPVMQPQTYELDGCKPNGWVVPGAPATSK